MSYGLKYTIPFKTISEVSCVINIEVKDFVGTPTELIAGATPIRIDTDTADVLIPIRSSSATIEVFGSDYLQDIYTNDSQGIKVSYYKNSVLQWVGYVIQETFSQDFSNINFTYEIECVSALSTLRSKRYDLASNNATFIALIKRARDLAGYSDCYLTSTITTGAQNIYEVAEVAAGNFYDELGEAMTYYEILEEIAKYLGCTFTHHGGSLLLIDHIAVRQGMSGYHKYVGDARTSVTLSNSKAITGDDYKATGAKLNRIPGRNKIAINCSLYEIENLIPDIEEGLRLGLGKTTYSWQRGDFPTNTIVTVPAVYSLGYNTVQTAYYGLLDKGSSLTKVVRYTSDNIPNKLNFDTELRIQNYWNHAAHDAGNHFTSSDWVMKLSSPDNIFIHNKVYFSFFCEVMANMEGTTVSSGYNKSESIDTGLIMLEPWSTAFSTTTWQLKLKLRIGSHYYNGTTWTTTDSTFNAAIEIAEDEKKYGRFIPVKDTNDYTLGIGNLSGYIINPPSQSISGGLELTIYALWPTDFDQSPSSDYGVKFTFMRDIRLEYAVQDLDGIYDFTQKEREDVIYESDISADYTDQADDIDLKICTNVDDKLSLSSVMVGGTFMENATISSLSFTGIPEEGLIERASQVYGSPRLNITPTLTNTLTPYSVVTEPHTGKTYVVAGGEEDAKMESCTYNLIEL